MISAIVAPIADEPIKQPFTADAEGSAAQYPVYRDRYRPLRVVIAVTLPLAAVVGVLFVLLAR